MVVFTEWILGAVAKKQALKNKDKNDENLLLKNEKKKTVHAAISLKKKKKTNLTQRSECSQDQSIPCLLYYKHTLYCSISPALCFPTFMKGCLLKFIRNSVFKCKDLGEGIESTSQDTHIYTSAYRKLHMLPEIAHLLR